MTIVHHPTIAGLQREIPGDPADWVAMGWIVTAPAAPDPAPSPTPLSVAVIKHKAVGK